MKIPGSGIIASMTSCPKWSVFEPPCGSARGWMDSFTPPPPRVRDLSRGLSGRCAQRWQGSRTRSSVPAFKHYSHWIPVHSTDGLLHVRTIQEEIRRGGVLLFSSKKRKVWGIDKKLTLKWFGRIDEWCRILMWWWVDVCGGQREHFL